jgi:hypothetical protein
LIQRRISSDFPQILAEISFGLRTASIQLQNKNCKQVLQNHQRIIENAGPHAAFAAKTVNGHARADASRVAVKGFWVSE